MTHPVPRTQGPLAGRGARRVAVAAAVAAALLAACGREPAPGAAGAPSGTGPAAAPAPHPADEAVRALLAAVDTADVARFAALSSDRKDPDAKPARADDVRATLEDLHQRYGLRARTVPPAVAIAPTGSPAGSPAEADVEVALDGGAAVVVLTMRRGADGVWRLVSLSEAAAPTMASDGPPADGPPPPRPAAPTAK